MTTGTDDDYEVRVTATATSSLQALPPRVAEHLVAFIFGSLRANPRRRGKPSSVTCPAIGRPTAVTIE